MSAYMLENETINNIVNSFYWLKENEFLKHELKKIFKIDLDYIGDDNKINEDLKKLGQLLVDLNQESINQRYSENTEPFNFEYSDIPSLNKFQFLKSVECLIYQSCEGNCNKTKIFKFLENLRFILMSDIINNIEEYKKAKWK